MSRPCSSPLARRLASEEGLDINQLRGSGPGGRIIKRHIDFAGSACAAGATTAVPTRTASDAEFEDIALTQIRKTIARRLGESIGPIPTFYFTAGFDLGRPGEKGGPQR